MFRRYAFGQPRYPHPGMPHYVVAVDLGKRKVGVAVFWVDPSRSGDERAMLTHAATVTCNSGPLAMAETVVDHITVGEEAPVLWVCEWPMKYGSKRRYHDAIESLHKVGDLIERQVEGWDEKYRPGEWKGNAPKSAHHKRLRKALRPEEVEVAPPGHEHDAWDAIGIGLFATGRTDRGGV